VGFIRFGDRIAMMAAATAATRHSFGVIDQREVRAAQ
jgi:hypothetical protein